MLSTSSRIVSTPKVVWAYHRGIKVDIAKPQRSLARLAMGVIDARRAGRCRPAILVESAVSSAQRLENWKLRRALALPYFLRSTMRESRVRNPRIFKAGRLVGS